MPKAHPYLNFDGTCEEAFKLYRSVFGGEYSSLMRYKEMPEAEAQVGPEESERIMHMSLPIGDGLSLMGSDISKSMNQTLVKGNNIYIMVTPDSKIEAERVFEALSAGGSIEMPLQKTFWGDWYGSFTDRFGIRWMIDCEDK